MSSERERDVEEIRKIGELFCVCVCVLVFSKTTTTTNGHQCRPRVRVEYPPNLSILISGGKETNRDSLSKGD